MTRWTDKDNAGWDGLGLPALARPRGEMAPPRAPEPGPAPEFQFHQLIDILRRRKGLIFTVTLAGTILAVAAGLLIPPKYTAKALVLVEPQQASEIAEKAAAVRPVDEAGVIDTHVTALASNAHLQLVQNSLAEDPDFKTGDPATPWPLATAGGPPSLYEFERRLKVNRELRSRVIAVEFTSTSPKKAAAVANQVVRLYMDQEDARKQADLNREMAWFNGRLAELKTDVERAEAEMRQYRIAHAIPKSPRTDMIDQQLAALNSQLGLAKSDQAGRRGRQGGDAAPGANDGERIRAIQRRLAIVQGASEAAGEAGAPLLELARQAAASGELYDNLLRRQNEIRERRDMAAPEVRLLSAAVAPSRPSSPAPILFILPAAVFAAISGCFLAVILERLDRGLRSAGEISEALGIPCIGLVPALRRMGRKRPHDFLRMQPFAAYTEAIRSVVVTALQLGAPSGGPKVILVSSSVPNEGKTTLAVSFAVYAALLRPRVLLIDFDFRHSATLRELGGKPEKAVIEAGDPDQPFAAAIQRIPDLSLDYLPLCRSAVDPLGLFAGEEVRRLLDRLREDYDCVVIDSPPLLAVAEARLLALVADKVLFAVRWGGTRREVAQSALNLLRAQGSMERGQNFIGAVVTQVNLKKHALYRYGDTGEFSVKYKKYFSTY
jgi:uncharacterized protein involved in exopolysaccharide biosynthesis